MPPPSNTPQKYKITPTIKTSNANCKLKTLNTLYIAENTFFIIFFITVSPFYSVAVFTPNIPNKVVVIDFICIEKGVTTPIISSVLQFNKNNNNTEEEITNIQLQ